MLILFLSLIPSMISMSTDLIPAGEFSVSKYGDSENFSSLAAGGTFLPRIMLMNSSSNLVKEAKISQSSYALVRGKDQFEDLTKEVPVLVISWRPKALEIDDGEVLSAYNPKSPEFKRIAEKSGQPDSGCMFGPEFLLYIPSQKCYATYFMASATSRREAPNLKALTGKAALLRSHLIKGKKHSWWGPVVTTCSSTFEVPPLTEIKEQADMFNNPPENEKETVDPAAVDQVR